MPTDHGLTRGSDPVYAVFGDKGNGLSSEFLDPVGTVRVLGPHAAAMIPLKYPRRYKVPTDPSKSLTCNDEKHKTGGGLEALRKTWVVNLLGHNNNGVDHGPHA